MTGIFRELLTRKIQNTASIKPMRVFVPEADIFNNIRPERKFLQVHVYDGSEDGTTGLRAATTSSEEERYVRFTGDSAYLFVIINH